MASTGGLFTLSTAIFCSPSFLALGDRERWLLFYFYGGRHKSLIGAAFLPDEYIAAEFNLPSPTVSKSMGLLLANGWVCRFGEGKHLTLPRFIECNTFRNPNILRGAIRELGQLPPDKALFPIVWWMQPFVEKWNDCATDFALVRKPIDELLPNQRSFDSATVLEQSRFLLPVPVPVPVPDTSSHYPHGFERKAAVDNPGEPAASSETGRSRQLNGRLRARMGKVA
jgi:hypothetical protein